MRGIGIIRSEYQALEVSKSYLSASNVIIRGERNDRIAQMISELDEMLSELRIEAYEQNEVVG